MAKDQEAVRGSIGLGTSESGLSCRTMSAQVCLLVVTCGGLSYVNLRRENTSR